MDLSRSMLHLLNAQQVTNQHLYKQMQLNNTLQQPQVEALRRLQFLIIKFSHSYF